MGDKQLHCPYRDHSVYVAACIKCGTEIESRTLPVPDLCPSCQTKKDKAVSS